MGGRQIYRGQFWMQPADEEKHCEAILANEPGQRCPQAGCYSPRCHSAPQSLPGLRPTLPHSCTQGAACGGRGDWGGPAAGPPQPLAAAAGRTFWNLRRRPSPLEPQREVVAAAQQCELTSRSLIISRTENPNPPWHPATARPSSCHSCRRPGPRHLLHTSSRPSSRTVPVREGPQRNTTLCCDNAAKTTSLSLQQPVECCAVREVWRLLHLL